MSEKCACHIVLKDGTKVAIKDAHCRELVAEQAIQIEEHRQRLNLLEAIDYPSGDSGGSSGSAKLYLHRVKVNSIYNEETWAEDPSFEFYIIFYRTSNTPVTAFNEIQPYEMKLENPFQLIKYDAPEANVIAIGIEKRSDGNLRINYINNINEFEGSWLNYENYHFSVFTIEDTVYEV